MRIYNDADANVSWSIPGINRCCDGTVSAKPAQREQMDWLSHTSVPWRKDQLFELSGLGTRTPILAIF
jgi:hypothetical protein